MGELVSSYWWVKLVWFTGGHGLGITGMGLPDCCSDLEQVVCVLCLQHHCSLQARSAASGEAH